MTLLGILREPGRHDAVERFLVTWHGERCGESAVEAEGPMPEPLRRFYGLAGAWPGVIAQNTLLSPDELELQDGKLVFYVENQGVYLWATETEGGDAPVWGRFDPALPWEPEGDPLSRYLLAIVVFEAAWGSPYGASAAWVAPDELAAVVEPLEALPLEPWRWPDFPTRFFAAEGLIAVAAPNRTNDDDTYSSLVVGAQTLEPLGYLAPLADWEYYSPRDQIA